MTPEKDKTIPAPPFSYRKTFCSYRKTDLPSKQEKVG
jgi:hypothetical protein